MEWLYGERTGGASGWLERWTTTAKLIDVDKRYVSTESECKEANCLLHRSKMYQTPPYWK